MDTCGNPKCDVHRLWQAVASHERIIKIYAMAVQIWIKPKQWLSNLLIFFSACSQYRERVRMR